MGITLEDIRPPIWRRVLVSGDISLTRLHDVIQRAMGWENYHLHAFQAGEATYGVPDPDFDELGIRNEKGVRLSRIAPQVKSWFRYEYDFGDDWLHRIAVEKILPAEESPKHPVCVAGKQACPPEDCGGPGGYADLLEAITDPHHEEHAAMLDWVGGAFDPEAFDLEVVNTELSKVRL